MAYLPAFRHRIFGILACVVCIISAGCKKAYIQFGEQFIDNNYTNIILVDTISPVLSTVFRDSITTSQTGKLAVGSYHDPVFGQISSAAFFILDSPSDIPGFHTSAVFDSLELRLVGDSTFYGDTTVSQQFLVHQLSEMINFSDGESSLYNTSNFSTVPSVLGIKDFTLRPSQQDSLHLRLSDEKGNELWNLLQNKAIETSSATDFEHYFKGLKIATGTPDKHAAIYGFSDTVVMRLYYHEINPELQLKYIDFPLTGRNRQFNQISWSRAGTILDVAIPESKEIPSALLANAAYLQPITGVLMKIRFPNIREAILQREDYLQLMSAELVLEPRSGSYSYFTQLPPELSAYTTDNKNLIGNALGLQGTPSSSYAQNGDLKIDWLNGENTFYTYDITAYLNQQITLAADNTNGLLFSSPYPAFNTLFNRTLFDDRQNGVGRVRLKVYYISVHQQN
ncbi:MAG: DUF4270 family protein [Chitinophagaceae bacterium]|nr:DUF4270 family protein [Chitinophagaceae bacterium]MCW5929773.1 DUF4270 family protein [Chitinophagaceae bacterium]